TCHSSPEQLPLRAVRYRLEWSQWLSASLHHEAAIEPIRNRMRSCLLESRSRTQQRHKRWRSERTADYPTAPGAPYPRYRVSDIQDSEGLEAIAVVADWRVCSMDAAV